MLGATVRDALAKLDEVRLPLHILHDAPFGELNENQEEMIETARAAADAMDDVLRRLMVCSDVDRDAFSVLLERVSLNDVLRGVLPMLRASGERRGAQLQVDLDPALPKVMADRTRVAEAVALLGADAASATGESGVLRLASGSRDGYVWLSVSPVDVASEPSALQQMLAARLLTAQGGAMVVAGQGVELRLPIIRGQNVNG
jgi:signal transduction histidine kinase